MRTVADSVVAASGSVDNCRQPLAEIDSCSAIAVAYVAFQALVAANCMMFVVVYADRGIDSVVAAALATAVQALAVNAVRAWAAYTDPAPAVIADQAPVAIVGQASAASADRATAVVDVVLAMVDVRPNVFVAVNCVDLAPKMIVVFVIEAVAVESMLVAADSSGHLRSLYLSQWLGQLGKKLN